MWLESISLHMNLSITWFKLVGKLADIEAQIKIKIRNVFSFSVY